MFLKCFMCFLMWYFVERVGAVASNHDESYRGFVELIIDEKSGQIKSHRLHGNVENNNFTKILIRKFDSNLNLTRFKIDFPNVNFLLVMHRDMKVIEKLFRGKSFPAIAEIKIISEKHNHRFVSDRRNALYMSFLGSLPDIESVVLSHHNFRTIVSDLETNLNMKNMEISLNKIEYLKKRTFSNFKKLEKLNIRGNFLEKLNENIFDENLELKLLDVSSNELSSLPEQIFCRNIKLQKLLIFKNYIKKISPNLFEKLGELMEINMSENQIDGIPENLFVHNLQLKIVKFSQNKLKAIPKKLFQGLAQLEQVRFDGNQIVSLDAVFKDTIRLKSTYFGKNEINKISPEIFPRSFNHCIFRRNPCSRDSKSACNIENCFQNWNYTFFMMENG